MAEKFGDNAFTATSLYGPGRQAAYAGALSFMRRKYTRDLAGPWLLFDNQTDPYQQDNLIGKKAHRALQAELDKILTRKLAEQGDKFQRGEIYLAQWGYEIDGIGTVPYRHK